MNRAPHSHQLDRLVAIVDRLRDPGGCPWDRKQDLRSMRPYLLEELHEVLDAIEEGDDEALQEELGDLLFNVLMTARIARDEGRFDLEDVARRIADKMERRHPHVFGDDPHAAGTLAEWEAIKERPGRSRLDGVPRTLPALLCAHRQGEKAAAAGFDWPDAHSSMAKVHEELAEVTDAIAKDEPEAIFHEIGDLLLAICSLARKLGVPPEDALQAANNRFARRFREMERLADERGLAMPRADLDALWNEAKRRLAD